MHHTLLYPHDQAQPRTIWLASTMAPDHWRTNPEDPGNLPLTWSEVDDLMGRQNQHRHFIPRGELV